MRSDVASRVKVVFGLVFALILMVLGMVLITRYSGGPSAHAQGPASGAATPTQHRSIVDA